MKLTIFSGSKYIEENVGKSWNPINVSYVSSFKENFSPFSQLCRLPSSLPMQICCLYETEFHNVNCEWNEYLNNFCNVYLQFFPQEVILFKQQANKKAIIKSVKVFLLPSLLRQLASPITQTFFSVTRRLFYDETPEK